MGSEMCIRDRFKRLGAVASVQPAQIALDERSAAEKLGEERASRYYALRTFLENGVPLAGGSDWPIVSADVFAGMRAAVERGDGHESQSLTAEEATTMFTRGGAHARSRWTVSSVPWHPGRSLIL